MDNNIRVIFLDIDGVLNHTIWWRNQEKNNPNEDEYPYCHIDPSSVKLLNKLIATTNAKVVISSVWKSRGVEQLQKILDARGFIGEIIDITPSI